MADVVVTGLGRRREAAVAFFPRWMRLTGESGRLILLSQTRRARATATQATNGQRTYPTTKQSMHNSCATSVQSEYCRKQRRTKEEGEGKRDGRSILLLSSRAPSTYAQDRFFGIQKREGERRRSGGHRSNCACMKARRRQEEIAMLCVGPFHL